MCCVSVGNQKLQARWGAEQHKRQRILSFRQAQAKASEKTGFWVVGNKKEPSEKDSFIIA